MATLALTDLDSGLYFDNGKWTGDHRMAQAFPDPAAAFQAAKEFQIENAAVAVIDGNPSQVRAYFWPEDSN